MSEKTSKRAFLFDFRFSNNVAFVLEFGDAYVRFFAKHAQVINDDMAVYEIETPYALNDLWNEDMECCNLQITQVGDVLYLFCKGHSTVRTLTRISSTVWELGEWVPKNGPWGKVNTEENYMRASGVSGDVTINTDFDIFLENDVGRLIRLTVTNDETKPWVTSQSVGAGEIRISDGHWYKANNAGTTGVSKPVHTQGTKSDGGVMWEYVHSGYGIVRIKSFVSSTQVEAEVLSVLPTIDATSYWELGVLKQGIYPICGVSFKNRFAILVNTNEGLHTYLSCVGDYDNYADKDHGEVLDESAIDVPINSDKYHEGCWLCSAQVLFVGTSGGEFYIDATASGQTMSPTNVASRQISRIGSKPIPPLVVNGHVLFVDRFGTSIRDLAYSFDSDDYAPMDLTIMGRHLLFSGITTWVYQDIPNKIIWCAVGDGRLIGFTFNVEQQIAALHQHNLSGFVESLAVIPSPTQRLDDVWVSVRRIVSGVNVRYVEWIDEGTVFEYNDKIESVSDIADRELLEKDFYKQNAFFVDSGIVYNRPAGNNSKKITGLNHLKKMEVVIMADGAERPRQTVGEDGSIEIRETDLRVLVGLPVKSMLIPQKIYIQTNTSQGLGAVQRIDHLNIMMYRSGGGQAGAGPDELIDILYRQTDDEMGKSVDLFSGNYVVPWNGGSSQLKDKGADIVIYNDSVYPMHILAISPSMSTSDWG